MKVLNKIFLSIFLLISILDASNLSEKDYIKKANSGNIEAMIELYDNYPYFLRTKTGRDLYEKWYKSILKSKDTKKLSKFIEIYNTYPDYFINQMDKIKKLYELKSKVGTLDDTIDLILEYYRINKYKYKKIYKTIEKKATIDQLLKLEKSYYLGDYAKKELERRGYKTTVDLYNQLRNLSNKKELETLKEKILSSKNVDDLNSLARYFNSEDQKIKAIETYKKVLSLDAKNYVALSNLSKICFYRSGLSIEDEEDAVKYSKLAIEYHQSIPSMLRLLEMYKEDIKYLDLFPYAVNQLMKSTEGKEKLRQFYYKREMNEYGNKLSEQLAKEGDIYAMTDLIINYKIYPFRNSSDFSHEIEGKKIYWINHIIESKNKNFISKMYESRLKHDMQFVSNTKPYEKFVLENEDIIGMRNLRKIFEKQLIQMDDIQSIFKIADSYLYGKTVEGSKKALEIYNRLAKKGEIAALLKLGDIYGYGKGNIKVDKNKAILYNEKAAKLGSKEAVSNLTYYYCCNKKKDPKMEKKRIKILKKGVELGIERAILLLAYEYHYGDIIKKDYKKAIYHYNLIKDDNSYAMNNLGSLYENGFGVKKDLNKAFNFFTKSSEKRNDYGFYNLGRFYEQGISPVKKDIEKAIFYYKKAENNSGAKKRLAILLNNKKGKQ
ncbi:MAG: hypothetical protein C0625_03490 [Arcobacter sp.]|nr:MAG: hypothetical protein C0625_03490 [Arcobacter sp.]